MNLLQNNPNRIQQPKRCCVNCGKSYKTQTNLEKHLLLCELLQRSQKREPEEDNCLAIPSQKIMYQLLLELGQKYNRLEEKVDEINKWVVKKKKKIDVIEWLNANIHPQIFFENLTDKIIITEQHIESLFHNSFNETLNEILANAIYVQENENINPIFAFIQKSNTIYICEKENNNVLWTKLSSDKLTKFLQKIQMKISKVFYDWKKTHDKEIREDEKLSTTCNNATIKLMAQDFKTESVLVKIKSMIYNNIKTDIKAFLEYEFEF